MPTKDYFSKNNFTYFWGKLSTLLENKVDKETGKGLSTNDFTYEYKQKLDWINVAYGTCTTAGNTSTKIVSVSGESNWTLQAGSIIAVTFTNTNSANSPKLDVNNTGARSIKFNGAVLSNYYLDRVGKQNKTTFYIYDGSAFVYIAQDGERDWNTIPSAYCSTEGSRGTKLAELSDYSAKPDSYTFITMMDDNSYQGALTLNINYEGEKPIYINDTISSATNYTLPAGTYIIFYDGTNYYFRTDNKVHMNITGDAGTVNGKTVGVNVPSDAVFTDTTYTFATGDNSGQIKITPSNGSAQNITVKNINNAAYKDVDSTIADASTSTKLPTSQAVASFVEGKGYVTHDTTYSVVSKTADGLAPKLPNETTTTKFLRQDGTWNEPPTAVYNVVSKTSDGLAPQLPNETTTTKFLRQDGTWNVPPGQNYSVVSKTADGLAPQLPNETATTKYLRQDGTWAVPPNDTYSVVSKTAAGLAPQLPDEISTTKYLRQDGTWAAPPGTTYNVVNKTDPGLAPTLPNETTTTKFLRQDASWAVPPDTKNTAGSSDTSSKIYLVGATTQASNPQTYSQDTAYVGTDGHLYSNGVQVVNLSAHQDLINKTYNEIGLYRENGSIVMTGGTTSGLTIPDHYTLGGACEKAVDSTIADASTSINLPTSRAVATFVEGKGYATTAVVSTSANGLAPQLPNDGTTTKYLREDGTWVTPPDTTYNVVNNGADGLAPQLPTSDSTYRCLRGDGTWGYFPSRVDYIGQGGSRGTIGYRLRYGDNTTASYTVSIPGLAAAAYVGIDGSLEPETTSTKLPTSRAVVSYVDAKPQILSGTSEPDPSLGKDGDIYILID